MNVREIDKYPKMTRLFDYFCFHFTVLFIWFIAFLLFTLFLKSSKTIEGVMEF